MQTKMVQQAHSTMLYIYYMYLYFYIHVALLVTMNHQFVYLRLRDTVRGRGLRTTLQKCFLLATIMQL